MVNILVMKKLFNISYYTYLLLLISFLCGYIKNILIIYFIIIFHEIGHILLIKLCNYKILSINIYPFGGITLIDKKINTSINKDILINLGGIFNQLLLFIILILFKETINSFDYELIYKYNLYILIFNILPIIPLDGNNIIHLLLEKIFAYKLSYYLNFIISLIGLIIFILLNIIYNYDNYLILGLLVYNIIVYIKNFKYLYNRFLLERYINDFDYKKINNNTIKLNDLKKEVLHYFKYNNKYLKEDKIIDLYFKNR